MQTGLRFMHNANWDDLRFVLAVADNGSVSGASRELGVNHATVLRRVAAFEEAHGAEVFERTAAGYRVRPDRARMIEAARNAAQAVAAVGQLMKWAEGPRDVVRLTSTDTLCNTVLADLPRTMPRHEVSLLAANGHLDLSRLEADVTVRPATALPAGMTGRAVAELGFATYRARGSSGTDTWLGLTGALGRSEPAHWMQRNVDPATISGRSDSFVVLREMASRGTGCAILPCILGDQDARLERYGSAYPGHRVPLWVGCHQDLADSSRLAPFIDDLCSLIRSESAALSG